MKGATLTICHSFVVFGISIHAPVKGATEPVHRADAVFDISIHAPVKGATWSVKRSRGSSTFQSTLP